MTEVDDFEFKTVFQQLSDYTIKRVEYIVKHEDADLDETDKRISTYQFDLLTKVSKYFKAHDIGILPVDSREFILHLLLPYYLGDENLFIITPGRLRNKELISALIGKEEDKQNIYTRLGLTTKARAKFYTRSIMPQSHEKRYDSMAYDVIVCATAECGYKTGINTLKSFDMTAYDEDRFSLIIIDQASEYSMDSWDAVIKSFGKSKRLFLIDPEFALDDDKTKYLIR